MFNEFLESGPGIILCSKFLDCILREDDEGIHKINGLYSKKNNVISHENNTNLSNQDYWVEQKGDYHDINMCIELDYDSYLADFNKFKKDSGYPYNTVFLFETSRGCWKKDKLPCTFCGLNDPSTCYKSIKPDLAIQYIQKNILPFLKVPEELWMVYETSSVLSKEELEICSRCGVEILQPGIESLNTNELKLMQKGISAFTNIMFLKHCIETGVVADYDNLYVPVEF